MQRTQLGPMLAILGFIILLGSLFLLLPIYYVQSLFLMFAGVVLIGIGAAFAKGVDRKLDEVSDECYYCRGTGMVKTGDISETCARCGGTGLARADD